MTDSSLIDSQQTCPSCGAHVRAAVATCPLCGAEVRPERSPRRSSRVGLWSLIGLGLLIGTIAWRRWHGR
jgi:predicted amidophosphoribosyltransferase